jgi:hypothetical protein
MTSQNSAILDAFLSKVTFRLFNLSPLLLGLLAMVVNSKAITSRLQSGFYGILYVIQTHLNPIT